MQKSFEAASKDDQDLFCQLADVFEASHAGILLTNAVSNGPDTPFCVYGTYSRLNHSCEPNVELHFQEEAGLTVVAKRDISAGEELFDCYVDASVSQTERRVMLSKRWRFECSCSLCKAS